MSAPDLPTVPLWRRCAPRASVRVQLWLAAWLWVLALGFLLVRGVLFLEVPGPDFEPDWWIVPVGLGAIALGVVKARLVLVRHAHRAVARIQQRGRACVFGCFGWPSWAFVAGMMTLGLWLRSSSLVAMHWGRALLCLVYLAVGTALLIADLVFWRAARRSREPARDEPMRS